VLGHELSITGWRHHLRLFVTNAAALVGLYSLNRLGASLGLRRGADARVAA
jgi:hypothetical protein